MSGLAARVARTVSALALLGAVTSPLTATSYVAMRDEDLIATTPLIVAGRVSTVTRAAGETPARDVRVAVEEVLAGRLDAGELVVRLPGGIAADGRGLHVFGGPRLRAGERAVLFLHPAADGTYRIARLALGVFHEVRGATGEVLLGRDLSGMHRFPPAGVDDSEAADALPEMPRQEGAFRDLIHRLRGAPATPARSWSTSPEVEGLRRGASAGGGETSAQTAGAGLAPSFTLLTDPESGLHPRWFTFDQAGSLDWWSNAAGQSGVSGGGHLQFEQALAAWTADPATPVVLAYAGTTDSTGGLGDTVRDGMNLITFDDPGDKVFDGVAFDCNLGGVLARGGVWFELEQTGTWNGETWLRVLEGDIVTNKNTGCYLSGPSGTNANAAEIFAHELGHTLGLGHSCGDTSSGPCDSTTKGEALMRAFAHGDGRGAAIEEDDLAGLAFLYVPITTPPPAPTGLAAIATGPTSAVLTWIDASSIESSFRIEQATGLAWNEIGAVGPNTTSFAVTDLAPLSLYQFRVRAANGIGVSAPSGVAAVTTPAEGACAQVVADGGFEGGTPNAVWEEESAAFPEGTPLCSASTCAVANQARSGSWWAWFGGQPAGELELAAVEQTVTLPAGSAWLRFYLYIQYASGNGVDDFRVLVDGTPVWSVLAGDPRYADGYREVALDLSGFADNGAHVVRLEGRVSGEPQASNFFLDDVSLDVCAEADRAPCVADGTTLCLGPEDRFEIRVDWRNHRTGATGVGGARQDTAKSGSFWFFDAANVELLVKLLDGRPVNGAFWVFLGGISDVEYWVKVRDSATGAVRVYHNPPGNLCGQSDVAAFFDPFGGASLASPAATSARAGLASSALGGGTCGADPGELCLLGGRFRVTVDWVNQHAGGTTGVGTAVPVSDKSGYFWFFDGANYELLVKILDGQAVNGKFWVFYGALSDVAYTITVTDLVTEATASYTNPPGEICGGADVGAL